MFVPKPIHLLAGCLLLPGLAQADTVWMKNGDRLSGKVLTLFTDGELGHSLDDGGVVSLDAEVVSKKNGPSGPFFYHAVA
jgi:hypothetical protein